MRKFAVTLPLLVAVGALIALSLQDANEETPLRSVLFALTNASMCLSFGYACAGLRERAEQARTKWTAALFGVGLLLLAGSILVWPSEPGLRGLHAPFVVFLIGCAVASVALFFLFGDLLAFATRAVRSVRTRLMLFGLFCGALAMTVSALYESFPRTTPLLQLTPWLISAVIVWGLARVLSERLIEPLESTVKAMEAVTGGDLEASLKEEGRDELAAVARAFNTMTLGLREREFLEQAFGRYVASSVLDALRKTRGLHLAPERREATILFADIRGFTAFSEAHAPEEVLKLLNVYFEQVVEVVGRHEGYLNKFIGDEIMVVFNAPVDQPDHPRRAVACARDLQALVSRLNAERAFGPGVLVDIGVGVNTGPVVAGNVGGERRAEFSVIGDAVNTAARLTSAAKAGEILVGEQTARSAGLERLEALEPLKVKGKAAALQVFRAAA